MALDTFLELAAKDKSATQHARTLVGAGYVEESAQAADEVRTLRPAKFEVALEASEFAPRRRSTPAKRRQPSVT
jgi:hypothetical protein